MSKMLVNLENDSEPFVRRQLPLRLHVPSQCHGMLYNLSTLHLHVSYGNRHCQASKGFDKHVRDDDAGFVDTSKIYLGG